VPRHAAARTRHPGDLLVRVGAVVFAVGVVAVLLVVVPFLTGDRDEPPVLLDLLALLLPAGLGLALLGLLRGARHQGVHRA
jgi:branched-subunit amino acid transport protein AzlD